MSDQAVNNQARPSMGLPLALGGGCALAGGLIDSINPITKSGYKSLDDLLAMANDTFETNVAANAKNLEDGSNAAKAYNNLVDGRKELQDALDAVKANYEQPLKDSKAEIEKSLSGDAKTAYEKACKDADDALTEALKNADDAAKKAAQKACDKKKMDAFADAIKNVTAKEDGTALEKAVHKRSKLVEEMAEKFKEATKTAKESLTGDGGKLKDFNWKDLKKILPKAKGLGALIYGAIGLVVGSIIARAVANGKNQA